MALLMSPPAVHAYAYMLKMRISFDGASCYMALLLSGRVTSLVFFSLPVAGDYRPLISFSREPAAAERDLWAQNFSKIYVFNIMTTM
jgi:hypothetical protein